MIPMTRSRRRRRAALRSTALGLALALMTGLASTAAGHGPDPVLNGPLFGQNQALLFDWRTGAAPPAAIKTAIRAAAADASSTRASKAATFAYDADGTNPIGYGVGATCGPNGIACFTRDAPDGFTMWLREQGHGSTGARSSGASRTRARRTAATTSRPSRSTSSATSRSSITT